MKVDSKTFVDLYDVAYAVPPFMSRQSHFALMIFSKARAALVRETIWHASSNIVIIEN